MDTRRLGLILILGGAALTVLSFIWFVSAYAEAMDMASDFLGNEYSAKMIACLYSSSPICQGAGMFSEAPTYSPAVFWIGAIALLAGIAVRFASGKSAPATNSTAISPTVDGTKQAQVTSELLGFISPSKYARYSYILVLSGAAAGLILPPLAIAALAGFVLALLGLTVFRPRLDALAVPHLGFIGLIFVAAALLLFATRGTFLFLLVAVAQIACLYVGFNSFRHGRIVTAHNVKGEFLMAFKPGASPHPGSEQR